MSFAHTKPFWTSLDFLESAQFELFCRPTTASSTLVTETYGLKDYSIYLRQDNDVNIK